MTTLIESMVATLNTKPRFDDRVILVTGASAGIGRALALELGKRGATVVLLGRNETELDQVYDTIVAQGGVVPAIVPCDLSTLTSDQAIELAEQIRESFGRLDGVAHIAGILGGREPIQSHRSMQWDLAIQINLTAVFRLTQALLPLLDESNAGRIVFATSSVGIRVDAYWGAYAVSKAGLEMFAGILSQELENTSQTRVFTVNPGGTRTKMRAEAMPGENPSTLPAPEIVANAFLYGLTTEAGAFHGQRVNARDLMAALGTWLTS
ncbi:SDR family NAD(P)-dependent oxidoreductase [Litoricola sp.]|nr:SDR family NAD(P)-dependent oxidoreductase [Litorivicinus sp.]